MSDKPVLRMRGVSKAYPGKMVLDRLDLDVQPGSVLGLLGKNGAGKTTLLKSAMGLVRPQSGEIAVLDEPAWTLSASAKSRIGYVPQTVELYSWMPVGQMIAYTASFYPRWNHELVERLVRSWEVPTGDRVGVLSEGSRQKLGILLALGHEPDLLILDEPASSLDPISRREFLATLLEMFADGKRTVIFSTHITSDVERVCDQVAILRNGRIIYHDELDALKDQVKRLRIKAPRPLPERVELPGLLSQRVNGNEALVSVRENASQTARWMENEWQASVEVQDLNLEDIFLELHDA